MIAYLNGIVAEVTEDNVVIDVNQIGYNVKISTSTAAALPGIGDEVKLYTYTYIKEDTFSLYGFLMKDDLQMFKLLITVNGIGPKGALAILSIMSADDLRFAIVGGDSKSISKASGVGAKTAQRVILDLKDKVSIEDAMALKDNLGTQIGFTIESSAKNEAVEALVSLGYSPTEALKSLKKISITEDMDTESILKAALKQINAF